LYIPDHISTVSTLDHSDGEDDIPEGVDTTTGQQASDHPLDGLGSIPLASGKMGEAVELLSASDRIWVEGEKGYGPSVSSSIKRS